MVTGHSNKGFVLNNFEDEDARKFGFASTTGDLMTAGHPSLVLLLVEKA